MDSLDILLSHRLNISFFEQPTLDIARQLIGKYFVVNRKNELKVIQITETEAYIGEDDAASHARFGRTKRTQIMYGPPGHLYIYLIYGIHYLLNIITESVGSPAGVLIRAGIFLPSDKICTGDPCGSPSVLDLSGPGRFTRALDITTSDLNLDLTTSQEIFIADSGLHPDIITTPRIGINYAPEPWRSIQWRFLIK